MRRPWEGVGTVVLVWLAMCLLPGTLWAAITIQPAFVEVNMDQGRPAGTFLISNVGDTPERFRIKASYFIYTENGELKQPETGERSLASWIHFNPRELTLAPKTQRAVRFAIVPRGKPAEGEWWAVMELESLNTQNITRKNEQTGRSASIQAVTKFLVPIFGTVGKVSYEGQVKDLRVRAEKGSVFLYGLVAATGTGRLALAGDYEIVDGAGKVVDSGPFALGYVLRGTQQWFKRKIDAAIPEGEYTARINLRARHVEGPIAGEAKVTWPSVAPVEVAAVMGPAPEPVHPAEEPSPSDSSPTEEDKRTEVQGSTGSP